MTRHPSLHYQQHSVADTDALIRRYATKEFNSPYRSTIPLLALLKDAGTTLGEILDALGVGPDPSFFSEYQVKVRHGRGKPSHTDLMITSADRAWAIEAKWTEARYPTVTEWIEKRERAGNPADIERRRANRHAVANGWLEYIREQSISAPDLAACNGIVYQMLHRAASACAAGSQPALVYLLFGHPVAHFQQKEFYRGDLEALHAALGCPVTFPFYLVTVPVHPTAAFDAIKGLSKGKDTTGQHVVQALLTQELFRFDQPAVRQVGM